MSVTSSIGPFFTSRAFKFLSSNYSEISFSSYTSRIDTASVVTALLWYCGPFRKGWALSSALVG